MKTIIAVFLGAFLSACATPKPIDLQAMNQAQQRSFQEVPRDAILEGIQEVFLLADPEDVSFALTPDGLEVIRHIATGDVFNPFISETWNFSVKEADRTSTVFASAKVEMSGKVYAAREPEAFNLFFNRLGFLVHRSPQWETCQEFEQRTGIGGSFWKPLYDHQFLCHFADDQVPRHMQAKSALP